VENLVQNAIELSDEDLERIKQIALSEPLLSGYLVSKTGSVTGIYVTITTPENSIDAIPQITEFARKKAKEFGEKYPELDVYLTGGVLFIHAFTEVSQSDMKKLIPIMFVVVATIIFFSLRSFTGTFATVLITIFSAVFAMGFAGWAGIEITIPSAIAPIIIVTLAIADSIHILNTTFYHMRVGKSKDEALLESLRSNMEPVFLTSLTTAIGFLSMNASDASPFHDLGNTVAVGVMAAYLFSQLLLPALISILPINVKTIQRNKIISIDKFGAFVVKRQKSLLLGMAVLLLILAAGLFRIELDDNFIEYFDEKNDFRIASNFAEEHLVGMSVIEFNLNSGKEGGLRNPEFLKTVEKFTDWYKKQPRVKHVISITDIVKRFNKSIHGDDPAFYRIPEGQELTTLYFLLSDKSNSLRMDLDSIINLNKSSTRYSVLLENVTSKEIRELERKGYRWLRQNAPSYMHTPGTGLAMLFAYLTKKNINTMLFGTGLALVFISCSLIFAFRNIRIGLISLFPNLLPAMMALGLWGLIMRRVNLSVSVLAAMSLGLVVDDTIHFLSNYLYAKRKLHMNPPEAVGYTFHTVGGALFKTSVILVSGFLVLSLSGFKVNAYMGILTAIAIAFALLADFLFLPPLLLNLDKNK
jgi:predicted RND superfamily exporter protein